MAPVWVGHLYLGVPDEREVRLRTYTCGDQCRLAKSGFKSRIACYSLDTRDDGRAAPIGTAVEEYRVRMNEWRSGSCICCEILIERRG